MEIRHPTYTEKHFVKTQKADLIAKIGADSTRRLRPNVHQVFTRVEKDYSFGVIPGEGGIYNVTPPLELVKQKTGTPGGHSETTLEHIRNCYQREWGTALPLNQATLTCNY